MSNTKDKNHPHPKKTFKQDQPIKAALLSSILINLGILIVIPHHFSFVSVIILLSFIFALTRTGKQMADKDFRAGVFIGFALSVLYAALVYYWTSKGPYGCGSLSGYGNCFAITINAYTSFEMIAAPLALALVTEPLTQGIKIPKTKDESARFTLWWLGIPAWIGVILLLGQLTFMEDLLRGLQATSINTIMYSILLTPIGALSFILLYKSLTELYSKRMPAWTRVLISTLLAAAATVASWYLFVTLSVIIYL